MAYVIVRYIIVKPVLHLKDVSDAVAHGDLDLRADIRTGEGRVSKSSATRLTACCGTWSRSRTNCGPWNSSSITRSKNWPGEPELHEMKQA